MIHAVLSAKTFPLLDMTINWEQEREHCIQRNWEWTLGLINRCQKEIEVLETENQKLKAQLKGSLQND